MEEVRIKLVIDGKESVAVMKLTDEEMGNLIRKSPLLEQQYKKAFSTITTEVFKYNKVTEESVNAIQKWLSEQNLSANAIEKTIQELELQNKSLSVNSKEWLQNDKAISNLKGSYNNLIAQNKGLVNTQKPIVAGTNQMNMALGQFGYVLNDAQMFAVNFRMGLMGISNNIPMVVQLFKQATVEAKNMGGGIKNVLISSLTGTGGLMIAINGVMLLFNLLLPLLDDTTEEVKTQSEEVDNLANKYEKLTRNQIDRRRVEIEQEILDLTRQYQKEAEGFVGLRHESLELTGKEKEHYESLINELNALDEASSRIGYVKNIENTLALLEEQRKKIKNPDAVHAFDEQITYYKKLLDEATVKSDDDIIKSRDKLFNGKREELQIAQDHVVAMAELQGASETELLSIKGMHLNQMLNLYKKYGKDVIEIQNKIEQNQQAIKNLLPGIDSTEDLEDIDLGDVKVNLDQEEIDKIKIQSIDNEYQRQAALADYEYQLALKKYEDYRNFEEIKTELDYQYTQRRIAIADAEAQHKVESMMGALSSVQGLFGEHTAAYKLITVAQIVWDTYQSAIAAYKSTAEIPIVGPILAPAAYGAALAMGAKAKKGAESQPVTGFAKGSFSVVGEEGLEVIAPMETYASGLATVVNAVAAETRRALHQGMLLNNNSAGNIGLIQDVMSITKSPTFTGGSQAPSMKMEKLFEEHFNKLDNWQKELTFRQKGEDLYAVNELQSDKKERLEY